MKKNILILAAVFVAGTVMSQDLTSKKGEMYLPEAGDYAIGIDATPILNYFGNMFSDAGNAAPTFGFNPGDGTAIYGKMFTDAQNAYRGSVRVGFGSTTVTTPSLTNDDEDETKISNSNITLGVGKEMRRGNTRLQGVYGAQALITFSGGETTTTDFGGDIADGGIVSTEVKTGSAFGLNIGVFGGVEYFFAPKMSVAGEYTWGIGFGSQGAAEETIEIQGADDISVEGGSGSSFGIDTGVVGSANLRMMFHF